MDHMKYTNEQMLELWAKWVFYARSLGYDDYAAREWATKTLNW
jgi:hypothetical protein